MATIDNTLVSMIAPKVAPKEVASKVPDAEERRSSKAPVKARGFFSRGNTVVGIHVVAAESKRLREDKERKFNWKRWGPYLSERQWATVREDYSPDGSW